MALAAVPYKSLRDLLSHESVAEEDPPTRKIIGMLDHVKADGELSRGEFLDICYWKSPRAIRLCERNSSKKVKETSRKVFGTRSEERRLELLTDLQGVRVPTASAILTLTDPKNYGVIDIRVWQLLHTLQSVTQNPGGQGFSFRHWYDYLTILRTHARRLKVSVRIVELTLFHFHQDHQAGTLYRSK